ncbi:MAG: hypothetical protein RL094_478 [Candidatus Parcubacteria bacterium]|jgi:hypothetical protein
MSKKSIIVVVILIVLGYIGYQVAVVPHPGWNTNPVPLTSTSTGDTSTPSKPVSTSTPTTAVQGLKVSTPGVNQVVGSPLHIKGQANGGWYFEGTFPVTLLDAKKKVLATGIAKSKGDWATSTLTDFEFDLIFPIPTTQTGTLVFERDNPSGLPQNGEQYVVPVRFASSTQNTITVSLFYPNKNKADQLNDVCSADSVVSLPREIPRTISPIQDAIKFLLKGEITIVEKTAGFSTEFPLAGVQLKGANLKNGTLTLDIADPQHKTSGGSCRAGLLRAQIEKTALQFAGVQKVVFKPELVFQP